MPHQLSGICSGDGTDLKHVWTLCKYKFGDPACKYSCTDNAESVDTRTKHV